MICTQCGKRRNDASVHLLLFAHFQTEPILMYIVLCVSGFPEMIEVIYQGFVWALDIRYPEERILHGGIHDILKDKVKREKVFLKNDYIVRVTGRASPYNINRLTFYTAKGKTFGPWGDRRSKESVDFDVRAPKGHALAYFSGTVDFGVPFRSISFHWRPIPS